ncbi:ATP-binding protein [Actinoplanes flavus]|uniref:Helix-turn-helix domain-containing protein n=1 Tax=Actinoplanes flavus TaxID=2820290 RepID=A0ABS3V0C0_9ACTN|nr:tetratricopeptide repeat protein [Actinoplanes flavus]MBO3744282.1 helix-turn-helix domain-containing protein [Actinoplanes flavus]
MRDELAGRLRQLRDLTGRSLRELERDIHVSSSSLSRYFSGQAVPPWPTVVALCRAAGRDPRPLREMWERAREQPTASTTTTAPPTVRNDLPHDVTAFTGRRAELELLLSTARSAPMVTIDGMGGVGKSALAIHAAHLLAADFPDGRLYLDLHGFTPGRERVEPAEALRVLLAALGLPPGGIPDGVAERAALWRSELATRRAIVLLDNAADADHVRDLLPGAGPGFVVITSRRRMVELDGVQPISLDVLPTEEAAQLFVASAGGTRPGDVGEVLRRCGNLPLAIRVAAARLRHRPAWTLDTLVERLRDGEPAVSQVFEMSLRQLDPAQRRMFGLLGLVPGEDIDAYGAAALAGIPPANARWLLEDLVDVHLVQEPAPGRYRMHDLLRQTAVHTDGAAADPAPAIARLADYYLSGMLVVKEQVEVLIPLPVTVSQPPPALPGLADYETAVDWMDTEWLNLTATLSLAVRSGLDTPAVGLGQLATISYGRRGGAAELHRGLLLTLPAAERLGDRRVLAAHRYLLGAVLMRAGRPVEAAPPLEQARELMAAEGDTVSEAFALLQLAEIRMYTADAEGAVALLRRATALRPPVEAVRVRVCTGLGQALVRLGQHAEAREVVAELIGSVPGQDRQTERMCLEVLGRAALGLGDARAALDFAERAIAIDRSTRHPIFEAADLTDAAVALLHLGRPDEATARQAEAMRLLERAGEPHRMARSLLPYAQACLDTGDRDAAARHFRAALEVATTHGLTYLVTAARAGLTRAS